MNWIVYHFAAGHAIFTGAGIVLLATLLALAVHRKAFAVAGRLLILFGFITVIFSATPLPLWFYVIWAGTVLAFLVIMESRRRIPQSFPFIAAASVVLMCLAAALMEFPYHRMPPPATGRYEVVCVIGDSVTAGIGEETTWPELLRRQHGLSVEDFSRAGATVESALPAAKRIRNNKAIVFLEIGGNDLLNSASAAEFRDGLDRLLKAVSAPDRKLVMLELPGLPFRNRFGAIQRQMSERYGVALVPKRCFTAILRPRENTVDGIHLTQQGQQAMADLVWRILGPAFTQ